jgi:hypothetical protein
MIFYRRINRPEGRAAQRPWGGRLNGELPAARNGDNLCALLGSRLQLDDGSGRRASIGSTTALGELEQYGDYLAAISISGIPLSSASNHRISILIISIPATYTDMYFV